MQLTVFFAVQRTFTILYQCWSYFVSQQSSVSGFMPVPQAFFLLWLCSRAWNQVWWSSSDSLYFSGLLYLCGLFCNSIRILGLFFLCLRMMELQFWFVLHWICRLQCWSHFFSFFLQDTWNAFRVIPAYIFLRNFTWLSSLHMNLCIKRYLAVPFHIFMFFMWSILGLFHFCLFSILFQIHI